MAAPQPSAVRFFAPDHPALAATIRARLEQRRADLIEELLLASDWADFNKRRGVVKGIDEALLHCSEVERDLNERHK